MIEYRKARQEEAADLLDFINYVYSFSHYPTDFKKLLPDLYDSGYPFWKEHYVAVENGRIRGTVHLARNEKKENGETYVEGYVGMVSTHPYHRGKNYMRILMDMALEDMKNARMDYTALRGKRQRYGYFGYEPGDYAHLFQITTTNMRHVMAGREPKVSLKKEKSGYSVWMEQKQVGILDGESLVLEDYSLAPDAITAYFDETGKTELSLEANLYDIEWAECLSRICEKPSIGSRHLIRIFNFRRFLEKGLRKRAQAGLCADGQITLQVGEERFGLWVKDGQVGSFETDQVEYCFEPFDLQRLILSLSASAADRRFPFGWFPISL